MGRRAKAGTARGGTKAGGMAPRGEKAGSMEGTPKGDIWRADSSAVKERSEKPLSLESMLLLLLALMPVSCCDASGGSGDAADEASKLDRSSRQDRQIETKWLGMQVAVGMTDGGRWEAERDGRKECSL